MSFAGPFGSLARRSCRAAVLVLMLFAAGCPGGSEGPSDAADAYIAQAEDEEERLALIEARDEIDEEMREEAAEMDAEIERLRRENEELRGRLARQRP